MSDAAARARFPFPASSAIALAAAAIALALAIRADLRARGASPIRVHESRRAEFEIERGQAAIFGDLRVEFSERQSFDPSGRDGEAIEFELANARGRAALALREGESGDFDRHRITLDAHIPADERSPDSALLTVERLVQPRRIAALAPGESFEFMGVVLEVTQFGVGDPADRADDVVEVKLTVDKNPPIHEAWSEMEVRRLGRGKAGVLRFEIKSVTPASIPGRDEWVREGEALIEVILESAAERDSGGGRPIG
jgi:hypothetical protein